MKKWTHLCGFGLLILCASVPCAAQGSQTVQLAKTFKARALKGMIEVGLKSSPISGVSVCDCSAGWNKILSCTTSDAAGRFSFPDANGGVHFLRLISPGFNVTILKVQVTRWTWRKNLSLKMYVGA